jgi:2-keto-3-deoxy-L-fuconate dehydrogenase
MGNRLAGRRALVTDCHDFMGPNSFALFREEGADVVADDSDLTRPTAAGEVVAAAGPLDILIVNLAIPNPRTLAHETTDEQWAAVFDRLVHPMHRLVRAVPPQMIERRADKIVVESPTFSRPTT